MEKIETIEEYLSTRMNDKIARRKKSPVAYLTLLIIGIGSLVSLKHLPANDSLQMAVLTVGIIALAVGVVLTAMWLSGALWHYTWLPSHSKMKEKRLYLDSNDYAKAVDGLARGDKHIFEKIGLSNNGNSLVRILYSHDRAVAVVQACHEDGAHLEPDTSPLCFTGEETSFIIPICR